MLTPYRVVRISLLVLLALPGLAFATTWNGAALVDTHCATKADVAANPDSHTRESDLMCQKNGYGIFVDGKYYKFDAEGSKKALSALKASDVKDHVRVDVTGELEGDTIVVSSLELAH